MEIPDHNSVPKYISQLTSNQLEASVNLTQSASAFMPLCTKAGSSKIDLPKIEILKFTGNPTNYIRLTKTFEANIESVNKDSNRGFLLLIQGCAGKPKKLIEFCLMLNPQRGYLHASHYNSEPDFRATRLVSYYSLVINIGSNK